jgi:hypothetical protein
MAIRDVLYRTSTGIVILSKPENSPWSANETGEIGDIYKVAQIDIHWSQIPILMNGEYGVDDIENPTDVVRATTVADINILRGIS